MIKENEGIVIDGEPAIKPYYYMRNGLLHVRYTVDRCIELSESEESSVKEELAAEPFNKQKIFERKWHFLTQYVGKPVIHDGLEAGMRRVRNLTKEYSSGHKN